MFWRGLLLFALGQAQAGTEFIAHKKWPAYVNVLGFYHRFFPGVYKAVELMPLQKIPAESLIQEINVSTAEWDAFQKTKRGTLADRKAETQISRGANERLAALLGASAKETVAQQAVINSLKNEQRVALTPLDPLFWVSVIGKKAASDLTKLQSSPQSVTEVRIKSDKGILDYVLAENAGRYRIKVLSKGENALRVKGSFSKDRAPSSNLEQDTELKIYDLQGAFYQQTEDRLPFGPFPPAKDLYRGPDGNTHFKGDGHKHFF